MATLNHPQQKMTPERRAEFLRAFRASGGNWAAASRMVAHPLTSEEKMRSKWPPAMSSFRALATRDPEFGAAIQGVLQDCRDDVEREIMRRGQEGWDEPVFGKGARILDHDGSPAVIRKFSDNLLLARARALMPDRYSERKNVQHSGHITHGPAGNLQITSQDLAALDSGQREQLQGILGTIQVARREGGDVPALEYQPGETIDADFEVVSDRAPAALEEIEDGNTLAALERVEASETGSGAS